jgi:hypothetical protein
MRIRIGVGVFSANKDVGVLAMQTHSRWIFYETTAIHNDRNFLVIPSEVEESLTKMTRREVAKIIGGTTAGLLLPRQTSRGQARSESSTMLARAIPSSGEKLPVIGLGTWQNSTSISHRRLEERSKRLSRCL